MYHLAKASSRTSCFWGRRRREPRGPNGETLHSGSPPRLASELVSHSENYAAVGEIAVALIDRGFECFYGLVTTATFVLRSEFLSGLEVHRKGATAKRRRQATARPPLNAGMNFQTAVALIRSLSAGLITSLSAFRPFWPTEPFPQRQSPDQPAFLTSAAPPGCPAESGEEEGLAGACCPS